MIWLSAVPNPSIQLFPKIVPALFAAEFLSDDFSVADIMKTASYSRMTDELMELCANSNTNFVKSREDWLIALILANFGKTDKEIVQKAIDSWRTSVAANVSYHEQAAKLIASDNSVLARQYRLLASIYREISES